MLQSDGGLKPLALFTSGDRCSDRCAIYREIGTIIYRIYPALLFALCFIALMAGFVLVRSLTSHVWPLLLVPIPAVVIGYILMMLLSGRFPRIRYIDSREIDGLGYVHQPLGPMLLVCLIGFGVAIIQTLR